MTKSNQLKNLRREIKWRKKALAHLKEWKKGKNYPNLYAYTNSLGNELADYKKALKIAKFYIETGSTALNTQVEKPTCKRCKWWGSNFTIESDAYGSCTYANCDKVKHTDKTFYTIPDMSCPRFEAKEQEND